MVQTVALIITLVSGVAGGAGGGYFAMKYYNKSLVDPDELEKQIINKIYQINSHQNRSKFLLNRKNVASLGGTTKKSCTLSVAG